MLKYKLFMFTEQQQQQQPPVYRHYTGQPALEGTSSEELEDFVGAKLPTCPC